MNLFLNAILDSLDLVQLLSSAILVGGLLITNAVKFSTKSSPSVISRAAGFCRKSYFVTDDRLTGICYC